MTSPSDFETFQTRFKAGVSTVVERAVAGDLETPVSAYLKIARDTANSFLLESVEGGETLGRYSMIGLDPDVIWRSKNGRSHINRNALNDPTSFADEDGAPIENLKRLLAGSEFVLPAGAPPMAAGVFGFLGYDMVRQIEALAARPAGGIATPDSIFIRPTTIAVFDNVRQEIRLFTPSRPKPGDDAKEAWNTAHARLDAVAKALDAPIVEKAKSSTGSVSGEIEISSNTTLTEYSRMVERAIDYIRAGDIFQTVLSQRFSAPFPATPFALYRSLRRSNPSPFMFYLNFGEFSLVGSSPEILVRVRDGDVTIRPIAGTRPRGATPAEDLAFEQDLLNDPKERAEHLMLLDLGRNDVARSTKIGTVRPTETFQIERYSHVMHIVSNVIGELRDNVHPVDAVMAGFPAGTVSGAPKVRAMEIIDELEKEARGIYGGAIGYFSADGNVDTCIALRTAIVKDDIVHVQAGAGIVADSDPAAEQTECETKAKALFAAAKAALG